MRSARKKPSTLPIDRLLQARINAPQFPAEYEQRCFNAVHGGVGYRWQRVEVYQGYVICSVRAGDLGGYIYLVVSPHYERHYPIIGFNFSEDGALAEARAKVDAQSAVGYQWTKAEIYRGHVVCSVDIDASANWIYLIVSPHYQQDFPILGVNGEAESALSSARVKIDRRYEKRALQTYLRQHPAAESLSDEAIARLVGIHPRDLYPRGRSGPSFRPVHLQRQIPTDAYFNER